MKEKELTIKVYEDQNYGRVISATIMEQVLQQNYGIAIMQGFAAEVQRQMVEMYIEQHGPEIFESLAPGVMAETIKEKIRGEIAKRVLGEGK